MVKKSVTNTVLKTIANVLVAFSVIIAVNPASVLIFHQPKCPKQLR